MITLKEFSNIAEEQDWLIKNQDILKAERKSQIKNSDGFSVHSFAIDEKGLELKTDAINPEATILNVRCIINATKVLDSHRDLHIDGIWKKSLSELKKIYLCQEHNLTFKGIISQDVKPYTKVYTFQELGIDLGGSTECLVFDCVIKRNRNPYMFEQYLKGYVQNHSVRMMYTKEYFCMKNDNEDGVQFQENYDKYFPLITNKIGNENVPWFYAVTEAKIIDEGSAVVKGSCFATPTLSIEELKNTQAEKSLEVTEPIIITQPEKKKIFIN